MTVQRTSVSRTTSLAGAAVFGALAAILASAAQLPYPDPGFPFLRIDLTEIIDVLAFLVFGPTVGLLTSFIHYLFLNFAPSLPIYGPLLKLFSVVSMLLGMWLGYGAYARILKRMGGRPTGYAIMFGVGSALRAIVLTPINYVLLIFVFAPGFSPSPSFLSFYLGGLAIYNVVQTILATAISYVAIKALYRAAPNLEATTWFARLKSEPEAQTPKTY
jgi:riboflavin transporter